MNKLRQLGNEAKESSKSFNSLLGQKQELYNLAKVLAKNLIHDLDELNTFVKPSDKKMIRRPPVKKKTVKHIQVKRKTVSKKRVSAKKPVSSMQKLKANMKKAKQSKTQSFTNTTNKIVKRLEI